MEAAHEGICGAHQSREIMNLEVSENDWRFPLIKYLSNPNEAEATNKIVKNTLERIIEDNPGDWHNLLSEVLWIYRNSRKNNIGTTPYEFVYRHDVVLPSKVTVRSNQLTQQLNIPMDEYSEAMSIELQDLEENRISAFNHLIAQNKKVERSYNKKVKHKVFSKGELVWKTILPLGTKSPEYGKWFPNWEGPFKVFKVLK
ncbi:uncharacterized protein LOC114298943 [Camellia sinensis]|uniref:uncharacterized protein LOC114298943 n=1 Tax=Camellia sinensis TaxID=4442 RepID=UPI001035E098|nr:uncharacterized protein LOC114298943 [Camellia sinensis]